MNSEASATTENGPSETLLVEDEHNDTVQVPDDNDDDAGHQEHSQDSITQPQSSAPAVVEPPDDKEIKAREKNLKLAEAVIPPPPSMSLTSSFQSLGTRESKEMDKQSTSSSVGGRASTSSTRSSATDPASSKRAAAMGGSLTSSMNSGSQDNNNNSERNPLRYSSNQHAAKTSKARNSREVPMGPGAVRITSGDPSQDNSLDEEQGEVVALTAEAVDDSEDDKIRKLRESNEELRKQVERALQGERKALEEMQSMAQAPPANVAVVMGDQVATSVVSEEPPETRPTAVEQTEKICWNCAKGTVFLAGCCCIFCVIIVVVVVVVVGPENIAALGETPIEEEETLATRRSNLELLLQPLQPLNEEALNWLADVDQWSPELDRLTTVPPSSNEQDVRIDGVGDIVNAFANVRGSTVGTGEKKWMFIERYYLAVLYYSTNGANWKDNSGWLNETISHCAKGDKSWFGIQCENDSLLSITLETNNLDGTFPKEISALRNLQSIWMSGDGFNTTVTGTIPRMPANLTQIWLWNMQLSGSIPEQLYELSGLTSLRLYQNQLVGTVSSSIAQLSNLKTLELVGNQLTGTIPVLPNVISCDLASNKFSDTSNGMARGCDVFDQNP